MKLPTPSIVSSGSELSAACARCATMPAIAVDTEFVRTDTFYPKLGLIQMCDGDTVWLIDPLAVTDMAPLVELLASDQVIKVFHSCSEDLEVLQLVLGAIPSPLFDTQVAASFVGYGFSKGYANLVQEVLDLQLDKHETRSDWLQRPLTASQCQYAAEDVYYLMKVYKYLAEKLEATGRRPWFEEDMEAIRAAASVPADPENYYLRVKGAWKLSGSDLGLLRAVTGWREREAREKNRPRNRIVPDRVLLDLVHLKPVSRGQLFDVEGFHPQAVRRYGQLLLELLEEGRATDEASAPAAIPSPLDREARQLLSTCRDLVETRAAELGMSPELLARKKDLEVVVRSRLDDRKALPPSLATGWRYTLIGEELLAHVG